MSKSIHLTVGERLDAEDKFKKRVNSVIAEAVYSKFEIALAQEELISSMDAISHAVRALKNGDLSLYATTLRLAAKLSTNADDISRGFAPANAKENA